MTNRSKRRILEVAAGATLVLCASVAPARAITPAVLNDFPRTNDAPAKTVSVSGQVAARANTCKVRRNGTIWCIGASVDASRGSDGSAANAAADLRRPSGAGATTTVSVDRSAK